MFPEFILDGETAPSEPLTAEEEAQFEQLLKRRVGPEEQQQLELLLLERLRQRKPELEMLWAELSSHWGYEDGFYRFYHGSFKVYRVQSPTAKAVKFLRELLPERELNASFMAIIRDGTGKDFEPAHNREWLRHTRPILEAFAHARYMVEMAVRYADLPSPPQPMPSGWAALLYLYDLR